jgi:glycerol kinase
MKVILAIDLGTTGNRVIAFSKTGRILASVYYQFPQIFPRPAWVEHNPQDIWSTTLKALKEVSSKVGAENIVGIGITNQRETSILWNKKSGLPLYNAIVWQCRRTTEMCKKYKIHAKLIKDKTGLFLDPYFSATKIKWMIDNVPLIKSQIKTGNVMFGTVDSWILWNLTGGQVHATDPSNASRTMLFNIKTGEYDNELLDLFDIPEGILPTVKDSAGLFGYTKKSLLNAEIPIMGILGDQQASLFAHGGLESDTIKNTYGTGLFLVASTKAKIPKSEKLINTIAWRCFGKTEYAIEGSVFVGGAAIQWLRDGLRIIKNASESEDLARPLRSNEGVYFVPALVGLGAPHWDPDARGLIIGITRSTTPANIALAALESLAYQTRDVVEAIKESLPDQHYKTLKVDGGASKNNILMQFQADILNMSVERPAITDSTAFGIAGIAGIAADFWTQKEFLKARTIEQHFLPTMADPERDEKYSKWKDAVSRSLNWEKQPDLTHA